MIDGAEMCVFHVTAAKAGSVSGLHDNAVGLKRKVSSAWVRRVCWFLALLLSCCALVCDAQMYEQDYSTKARELFVTVYRAARL
jgi:hypothetical protein